jgi:hypothetical protein
MLLDVLPQKIKMKRYNKHIILITMRFVQTICGSFCKWFGSNGLVVSEGRMEIIPEMYLPFYWNVINEQSDDKISHELGEVN